MINIFNFLISVLQCYILLTHGDFTKKGFYVSIFIFGFVVLFIMSYLRLTVFLFFQYEIGFINLIYDTYNISFISYKRK